MITVKALVLDYGEVLCAPAAAGSFERFARLLEADRSLAESVYWERREPYDRGRVDGAGFWHGVAGALGTALGEAQVAELIAADTAAWTVLDREMLAWADAIAAGGLPVALLSNMVPEIGAHLRDELRLFDAFHHVTFSYEVGAVKPEPAVYAHVLRQLELDPGEVLLVDDREVNVDAARRLGWHAHLFRGRPGLLAEIARRYALGR